MNVPLEVYQRYISMGWSVIPVKLWLSRKMVDGVEVEKLEKTPMVKWQVAGYQDRLPTQGEIASWADKYNGIAVVTGKVSGVVVVDIDEVNQDRYPYLVSPVRVRSAHSRGVHYYYKYEDRLEKFGPQAKIEGLPMDYRGRGAIAMLPGSTLDDLKYTFEASEFDILGPIPDEMYAKLANPKPKFEKGEVVRFDELHATGDRNQSATQVAGKLLEGMKQELWEVAGWTSLQKWNETQCEPPLDERELRTVFESIAGKEARNRVEDLVWREGALGFVEDLEEKLNKPEKAPFFSGYERMDRFLGGFRRSNSYLVTGLEKSGKSSWLMKMIQNRLEAGIVVGYINTELPKEEFVQRMTGYWKNKQFSLVTKPEMVEWGKTFASKLRYLGVETMPGQEKMLKIVEEFVRDGIECLVFDNITSWGNKLNVSVDGWQVTADLADSLIQLTKRAEIVSFMVRHLNPSINENVTKGTLKSMVEKREYWKIFEDQVSVVKRPSTTNVYGGGQISSQMSGTIIIWRPYQKFEQEAVSKRSAIMVESFRHAPNKLFSADFDGARGLFTETNTFNDMTELVNSLEER